MAVTHFFFGNGIKALATGLIDLDTDTLSIALTTSAYTPDQDAHDFFDDVTHEVEGEGYVAGGTVLANGTVTYTAGSNVLAFNADDVSWPNSTITARRAIIYKNVGGTAASSPLLSYVDFGEDKVSTGGDFSLSWAAGGLFTITPAAP